MFLRGGTCVEPGFRPCRGDFLRPATITSAAAGKRGEIPCVTAFFTGCGRFDTMGRSNSFATRVVLVEVQEFGSATAKENPSKEFRIMGHTGQLLVRKL